MENRLLIALALGFASFTLNARAALLAYDGADYSTGLGPLDGGFGWRTNWSSGLGVQAGGLTYPGLAVSGNRFRTIARRPLATNELAGGRFGQPGTELWFSFLARREAFPALNSTPIGSANHVELSAPGFTRVYIGHFDETEYWGIRVALGSRSSERFSARRVGHSETTLLVARFIFGPAGGAAQADLFVNPQPGVVPAMPDASLTSSNIWINELAMNSTGFFASIDELRLGDTYADVVPHVPTLALQIGAMATNALTSEHIFRTQILLATPDNRFVGYTLTAEASDPALIPPGNISLTGDGHERSLQLQAAPGATGTAHIAVTLRSPGGESVTNSFTVTLSPPSPQGLLAYEPFDYPEGDLARRTGGMGFSRGWDTPTGYLIAPGSLDHASGPATGGHVTRPPSRAGVIQSRGFATPVGGDGLTRFASFRFVRRATTDPNTNFFYHGVTFGSGRSLFVGKPGRDATNQFVLEEIGGARQHASGITVAYEQAYLLVLRFDFFPGVDKVSLFVDPLVGVGEPATPSAVKFDLDLGRLTQLGLSSFGPWAVDELRVGTTWDSVFPGAPPADRPVLTLARLQNGMARLSWPASLAGFRLQSSVRLDIPDWQSFNLAPSLENDFNVVVAPISQPAEFFRLIKAVDAGP